MRASTELCQGETCGDLTYPTDRFLIIGGTSKAGTTSVFTYLASHPDIVPSRAKETRFFLDRDYPLNSRFRLETDGLPRYLQYFGRGRKNCLRLEATPDYLHSSGTAERISGVLCNVQFIFILREPIARMISWYRFGLSLNVIPGDMAFDTYLKEQCAEVCALPQSRSHPAFLALHQGRYSRHLVKYLDLFGPESIKVCFYETLRDDPRSFMRQVCQFSGLDEKIFDDYHFTILNRGVRVRNVVLHRKYVDGKQKARSLARVLPYCRPLLRPLRKVVDHAYRKLNVRGDVGIRISQRAESMLRSFYEGEAQEVAELVGVRPPW